MAITTSSAIPSSLGAETDFQGTSITGGNQGNFAGLYNSPYPGSATGLLTPLVTGNGGNLGLPWFGTVRGRAGYLVTPTLLLYGTAGFAYGDVTAFQRSNTSTGWTAGGGAEWMFAPHWSAKIEYLYVDLASSGINGAYTGWDLGNNHHPQINVVRAGVNYHFDWGTIASGRRQVLIVRGRVFAAAVELIDSNPASVAGFFLSKIAAPFPSPYARASPATQRHVATRRRNKRCGPRADVAAGRFPWGGARLALEFASSENSNWPPRIFRRPLFLAG